MPERAPEAGHAGRTMPRFRSGRVLVLAGSHFIHDVFTALLAPLLPLIIERLGLSLLQAGSLVVFTRIPSVFNPALGSWADRHASRRPLVILGPGVTGVLMCLIGVAPSYAALAILLLASGCSVAALHVAAPVMIAQASGASVGRGMSYFMVAGELARTIGPLIAVELVASLGLEGLWQVMPVAVASSLLLWWRFRGVPEPTGTGEPARLLMVWREMRHVLLPISGILIARAFLAGALTTFLPTFLYGEGESLWVAGSALMIVELFGAAGALISGTLSDRLGRRRIVMAAVAASPPLLVLFLVSEGLWRVPVLGALGFATLATSPVLMALTIENSGANPATANGTYMMIAFAARSVVLLAVGALGDAIGLRLTLYLCALVATLGIPFVRMLPEHGPGPEETPA
jgi:FSR family fosmidomycin resistance protein-like MFS transporter